MQEFDRIQCEECTDAPKQEGMGYVKFGYVTDPVVVDADVVDHMEAPKMETMDMEGEHEAATDFRDVTDVPVEQVQPFLGCGCLILSLFLKCPESIGCNNNCAVLCCQCKYVCCKLIDCRNNEDRKCCTPCTGNWHILAPTKLFECEGQLCCCDTRCAFPCTPKTPCILTPLPFVTLCLGFKCVGVKCCSTIGDMKGGGGGGKVMVVQVIEQ